MIQCRDCRFFKLDVGGTGHCRRYAPKPLTSDNQKTAHEYGPWGFWPAVKEWDCCGEAEHRGEEGGG